MIMTPTPPNGIRKWKLIGQWTTIGLVLAGSAFGVDHRLTKLEAEFKASQVLTQERFEQRMQGYMAVINVFKDKFEKIDMRVSRIETRLDNLVDNH